MSGALRIRIDAAVELTLDASLLLALHLRLMAQVAERLQLFGREDAAHAQFRLRAQADERGLRIGHVARALLYQRLVNRVGVDRLVERAPRLVEATRKLARLRHALALNRAHLPDLFLRQVELAEQAHGVVWV